uniref:Snake toxin/toxin-like domain-containing protein n=1 Tax=Salvator merianae TaxID=96440 RepID=A0A8D0BMS3_SALMN
VSIRWASQLSFLAVFSLQCFTCKEPTDLSTCVSIVNCSVQATACKTTIHSVDSGYPFFGNITVTKSCSENCVPSEPDGIGDSHPDYCCYTDLCNIGKSEIEEASVGKGSQSQNRNHC